MARDRSELRVEAQLGSALRFLEKVQPEVEAWAYFDAADELERIVEDLRELHEGIVLRGRRYQRRMTRVRNC